MRQYLVHFWNADNPSFLCYAEDIPHAVSQALNAYPETTPFSAFEVKLVWHSKTSTEEYEEEVRERVIKFANSRGT